MSFYVTIHQNTNGLLGISTFNTFTPPDDYVIAEFDGSIYDCINCDWDSERKMFVQRPNTIITKYAFLSRFMPVERIAARSLMESDPIINDFFNLLELAEEIDLVNTEVHQGLQYLVYVGVLQPNRVSEILL